MFNASGGNTMTGAPIGTWVAGQFYFSGSTNDFTRVNDAAAVTGASAGNNASPTGRSLGGCNGAFFSSISVCEIVYANILPSAGQIAWFSAYRLARYGF
jgi:hypothetical protein